MISHLSMVLNSLYFDFRTVRLVPPKKNKKQNAVDRGNPEALVQHLFIDTE